MTRGEARAVAQLYRAAQLVLTIPGYRWSRDQIDRTRELLTDAGLEVYPFLATAWATPQEIAETIAATRAADPTTRARPGPGGVT